jgi:hypothetical protein
MSRPQARDMDAADLATALRHHAASIDAHYAAVDLLIDHGVFLARPAFREQFVRVVRCTPICASTYGGYVRWGAVATALNQHRLACSSSEADILRIASSLGGNIPIQMGRVLGALDNTNIGRVIDAILTANGSRVPTSWRNA